MKNLFVLLFLSLFSIISFSFNFNIPTFIIFLLAIILLISTGISIFRASVGKHFRIGYYFLYLIFIYPVTFIFLFASFYRSSYALFNVTITTSWFDSLYFSIVTWTTLGYGDYQPNNFDTKLITSLEGFIGYLFSGIIIAMVFNAMKKLDIMYNA
ncbi:MAG TPA: two pore domain potassium channel family protein [Bacteroidia bacterium]|nr:two pore domain potassium channel family protein [Bacteroidia bacterium]